MHQNFAKFPLVFSRRFEPPHFPHHSRFFPRKKERMRGRRAEASRVRSRRNVDQRYIYTSLYRFLFVPFAEAFPRFIAAFVLDQRNTRAAWRSEMERETWRGFSRLDSRYAILRVWHNLNDSLIYRREREIGRERRSAVASRRFKFSFSCF